MSFANNSNMKVVNININILDKKIELCYKNQKDIFDIVIAR